MKLSKKYKSFIKHRAPVEFLEGTTYAGKTTVGVIKFMLRVAESHQRQHIISGLDKGTIERNIISKDLGILDVFGEYVEYNPSGKGNIQLPHLLYSTPKGKKVIYTLGYGDKARWKKALGSQSGCILIDEINIADMEYVREASVRCDYLIATLNPDDPNLEVYKEYINRSRPLEKWKEDTPGPILDELYKEEPKAGWTHWFFSFEDNAGATEEKIEQIKGMSAPGTKLYKNKIQGLRGRHTGLCLNVQSKNIIKEKTLLEWLNSSDREKEPIRFAVLFSAVDTSYSRKSDDKIAFTFGGITYCGKLIKIATEVYNNTEISAAGQEPIAPSDLPPLLDAFLKRNIDKWGMIDCCYIDSADAATNLEVDKQAREKGWIYTFAPSWKKLKNIDRIMLENGWLAQEKEYIVEENNKAHIDETNVWSWLENKQEPEDKNDHTCQSYQYGWMPYRHMVGIERN
jgi:Terminase-like family.